jgi:UDP-2-acetamido-2-deoxy-ribo-hexuluronate aminotransferase
MDFIDLKTQQQRIRDGLESAIARILDHGQYIMGPEIAELEKQLADFVGARHCLACSSGTDALLLPLLAYEVGPGDAVFTTPFTYFATPEAIALTGATPVFVDIEPDSYNINPELLQEAIAAVSRAGELRPRGIMPVDIFGIPADYDRIMPIAQEHGLFVIEDGAQAFGAGYRGRRAPALADVGATSFFPAKPLGCYGDGGAVFTDDDELLAIMASLRIHGQGSDKYNNVRIGINARMDTIQAAVLLEKMKIYPDEIELRQKVAAGYIERLQALGAASPISRMPSVPEGSLSVYAQFCIESAQRARIQASLSAAGIPSPIYYAKPMHQLDAMIGRSLCADPQGCPVSEAAAERIFALPFHPYLSDEQLDQIVAAIAGA